MYNAHNIGLTPDRSIVAVAAVVVGFLQILQITELNFKSDEKWFEMRTKLASHFVCNPLSHSLSFSFALLFLVPSELALVRVGIRLWNRIFLVHLFTRAIRYRTVLFYTRDESVPFIRLIYSGRIYFSQARTKPSSIFKLIDLCRFSSSLTISFVVNFFFLFQIQNQQIPSLQSFYFAPFFSH